MANDGLLLLLVFMILVLVAIIWKIVTLRPGDAATTQTPQPAPLPDLLVSSDYPTEVLWVNEIYRPEVSSAPPWDLPPQEQKVMARPEVSGGPPWGPAPKPRDRR
jgi:hypothetical protein